ncbi:hypothetical protein C0993_004731 [Termitomyces sp. T159_Od127]|nr:hypothetical protein C0993_004731 [Termitomyces sp. T159_Od127]
MPRKLYRAPRRVIESSDSEDSVAEGNITRVSEVIELSDSSSEGPVLRETELFGTFTARAPTLSERKLFDSDREDGFENDDSILVLDEPRSARKPLRLPTFSEASPVSLRQLSHLTCDGEQSPTLARDIIGTKGTSHRPEVPKACFTPAKPMSTVKAPRPRSKETPRLSKKAQAAAERERRVTYAQSLFKELNSSVFEDKLPRETKLNWSKRLLTTAGRAKWHRY